MRSTSALAVTGSRYSSTNFMVMLDSARACSSSVYAWPMSWSPSKARLASSSSILDIANPTWMSTQSPIWRFSSSSKPMLMRRLTPLTSTRARCSWLVHRTRSAGRECRGTSLVLLLGDDFDTDLHVGMDAQHEDAGRLHAEVADVERRLALEPERAIVDRGDRDLVFTPPGDAPEREVAGDSVAPLASPSPAASSSGRRSSDSAWNRCGAAARDPRAGCPMTTDRRAARARRSHRRDRRPPHRATSTSKNPSNPSVRVWIGWRLELASMRTADFSGTMRKRAMPSTITYPSS